MIMLAAAHGSVPAFSNEGIEMEMRQRASVVIARNGVRNAAKTGGAMERALLASRYKPLILRTKLKLNGAFLV
jgi:hypothetical protein